VVSHSEEPRKKALVADVAPSESEVSSGEGTLNLAAVDAIQGASDARPCRVEKKKHGPILASRVCL